MWPASFATDDSTFQPDESLAAMLASALRSLVGDHPGFLFVKHARPADRVFWMALFRPATRARNGYSLLAPRSLPHRASLSLTLLGASLSLLASSACHSSGPPPCHLVYRTVRTRFPSPPTIPVRYTAIPHFWPIIPSTPARIRQQALQLPLRSAWACIRRGLMAPGRGWLW